MKTYGTVALDRRPNGSDFVIKATPDAVMRLKRIIPKIKGSRRGELRLSVLDDTCADLEMILTRWPMHLDADAREAIEQGAQRSRQRADDVVEILSGNVVVNPEHLVAARPPRNYQRVAAALALKSGSLLLADELGLGKSQAALTVLADPALRPMLVVTLTGLERQWCNQLAAVYPELTAHIAAKTKPYEIADASGAWPDVLVMNYPKLAGWAEHLAGKVKAVAFDEVQELRREESQKHAAACRIADAADVRMGLSATPVYNYGGEMYSIMRVLKPGLFGSREEFATEWTISTYGLDRKSRVKDPEALRAHMIDQGVFLRRTREDVDIELPPASIIDQYVDADTAVVEEATTAASEIARLILNTSADRQARWQASGELDWKMRQATGIAKAPFVADFSRMLLESEERIMLYGWHRSCYDIWRERLSDFGPVLYTGSESPAQKAAAVEAFTSGRSRVLIMSLRSGAGLDGLQDHCKTAVFGELDWSPGVHKQAIGRLHRPGQADPVWAYFCVSDFGADPIMRDTLGLKAMEADLLVNPETATLVQEVDANAGHIKALAQSVLERNPTRRAA